jgi:uncharacterized protein DUF1203
MTEFIVHALPAGETDGDGVHVVNDDRSPCRRCLRDAAPGDDLLLLPYDPFLVRSPYTGQGPVFVHAEGCRPHRPEPNALPEQVHGRQFALRAYDADAMMLDAEIVPGDRLAERARELLDGDAAFLHAHFAGPGCFAFRIDRA